MWARSLAPGTIWPVELDNVPVGRKLLSGYANVQEPVRHMPGIVTVAGYAGLLLCLLLFFLFGAGLLMLALRIGSNLEVFDTIMTRVLFALGAGGMAISVMTLRGFRVFIVAFDFWVAGFGTIALVGGAFSLAVVAVGASLCAISILLRHRVTGDSTRRFFGIASDRTLEFIHSLAWINIATGAGYLWDAIWPKLVPRFGFWPSPWQLAVVSALFCLAHTALGYGILHEKRWTRLAAVTVGLANLIYMASWAWDPNPQGRLPVQEATTQTLCRRYSFGDCRLERLDVLAGFPLVGPNHIHASADVAGRQ